MRPEIIKMLRKQEKKKKLLGIDLGSDTFGFDTKSKNQ